MEGRRAATARESDGGGKGAGYCGVAVEKERGGAGVGGGGAVLLAAIWKGWKGSTVGQQKKV